MRDAGANSRIDDKTQLQRQRSPKMSKKLPSTPLSSSSETISIIGPGMAVIGDCKAEGAIRIEGRVEGLVEAGAAVFVGKDAVVRGRVSAEDAVVSGRVEGTLTISSRLELRASGDVEGEIDTRRIVTEEGAVINGTLKMGS